jgi:aryl-alcohol dehydrogenase-like predicted oxidoreductase
MKQPISRRSFVASALALAACRTDHAPDSSAGADPSRDPAPSPSPTPSDPPLSSAEVTKREMPTRMLGKTGVKVSRVGLGGAHIGTQSDEKESIRIIRSAIDRGLTFMDNSWDYHHGQSEERMGKALRDGYRKKAFLMTKLDGRTRDAAAAQLEQSLRRLQTDMIDLVQIHEVIRMSDPERVFARGGAIEALLAARESGKLRFIGFTGHKDPKVHLAMLEAAERHGFAFDTVQMPLNVMDAHYHSFERLVLPVALAKGLGVLSMKPLGGGFILDSKVVTAPECLRYAMNLPTAVTITGCDSMRVLDQAIEVAATFEPMSQAEVTALLDRTRQAADTGRYERFKTSDYFDSTAKHPQWLDNARI